MKRAPREARSIMERRLFDAGVLPRKRQRAITLPVSIALHVAVVSAVLIAPMLGDSALPEVSAAGPRVSLFEPPSIPVPVPPPVKGTSNPLIGKPKLPPVTGAGLVAPPRIPDTLPIDDPGAGGPGIGDPDGVVGGADWGARAGAIVEGLPIATTVTQPVRISRGIREPRKLHYVAPIYPEIARRIRLQGTVVVECTIDAHGRVVNATVVQGNPLLNDAALAAVQQWVYTPTLLSGVPVPVLLQVSVTFTMS